MKKALILLSILFAGTISSQEIKIKKAAVHTWALGFCCSHGADYHIEFSSNVPVKRFVVDTIWAEGNYFVPTAKGKEIKYDSVTYNYCFEKKWLAAQPTDPEEVVKVAKQMKWQEYDGVILIRYRVNGLRKEFLIKQFTEISMTAYP